MVASIPKERTHARTSRSEPLSRGVRGRGVVGGGFGELCRIVQLEVTEDLVGGDVVVASAVLTDCFQEAESTDEVSVDERFGVGQELSLCDSAA